MASVASNVYIYYAPSVYELALSCLVAYLACFASLALVTLNLYPRDALKDDRKFRWVIQYLAVVAGLCIMAPSIIRFKQLPHFARLYLDMACYAEGVWPASYVYSCAWGLLTVYGLSVFYSIFATCGSYYLRARVDRPSRTAAVMRKVIYLVNFTVIAMIISASYVFLWLDMAFIILLRSKARKAFGDSYEDDAFGYGQIIASGFCLQAVLQYFHMLKCTYTFTVRGENMANTNDTSGPRPHDSLIDDKERMTTLEEHLTIGRDFRWRSRDHRSRKTTNSSSIANSNGNGDLPRPPSPAISLRSARVP